MFVVLFDTKRQTQYGLPKTTQLFTVDRKSAFTEVPLLAVLLEVISTQSVITTAVFCDTAVSRPRPDRERILDVVQEGRSSRLNIGVRCGVNTEERKAARRSANGICITLEAS